MLFQKIEFFVSVSFFFHFNRLRRSVKRTFRIVLNLECSRKLQKVINSKRQYSIWWKERIRTQKVKQLLQNWNWCQSTIFVFLPFHCKIIRMDTSMQEKQLAIDCRCQDQSPFEWLCRMQHFGTVWGQRKNQFCEASFYDFYRLCKFLNCNSWMK